MSQYILLILPFRREIMSEAMVTGTIGNGTILVGAGILSYYSRIALTPSRLLSDLDAVYSSAAILRRLLTPLLR